MNNFDILLSNPIINLQLIIDGILVGAIFSLAAYGMALIWGVMNLINLAQGEFVMLGGYVTILCSHFGLFPLLSVPIAFTALFLFGLLIYHLIIYRVEGKELFFSILATFGLSILLQQLANQFFGADIQAVESQLGTLSFFDGAITIPEIKVIAFVFALLFGISLLLFLKKTKLGLSIRATAQNAKAASILGINTRQVYAMTFALNAAICGFCGSLVAMTWVLHPYIGLPYTVRSFMIVVVSGLGNILGIIYTSAFLGAFEDYAGFIFGAELQTAYLYTLLVLILVIKNLLQVRKRKYLK